MAIRKEDIYGYLAPTAPSKMALPRDARKGPNCGVTAAAVATGCSFAESWNLIKTTHNKRKNWRGSTYFWELDCVFNAFGLKTKLISLPVRPGRRHIQLKTLVRDYLDPTKRYVIWTTKHVQVVRGDELIDQAGLRPVKTKGWAGKRVKKIVEIVED
jgi:hypothetical protein